MGIFKLHSDYLPRGDQPEAIAALTEGLRQNKRYQVLLGVTGSGKTFTIANVIAQFDRPVLVLSHNKMTIINLKPIFRARISTLKKMQILMNR